MSEVFWVPVALGLGEGRRVRGGSREKYLQNGIGEL